MVSIDSFYLDVKYELDNVDFNNKEQCDKSYYYIYDLVEVNIKNSKKRKTLKLFRKILRVLEQNGGDLLNCYISIKDLLNKKIK